MIKIIVFDLGNVILKFNHRIATKRLAEFSAVPEEEIYGCLYNSDLEKAFDRGELNGKEFFAEVKKILKADFTWQDFKSAVENVFQLNTGMDELLKKLKPKFKLCLLSNTNDTHFEYIRRKFPIVNIFDEYFLSYELHMRKPEEEIYLAVLRRCKASGSECVYIDDVQEFADAAEKTGFRAIRYTGVEDLKKRLKNLGIKF